MKCLDEDAATDVATGTGEYTTHMVCRGDGINYRDHMVCKAKISTLGCGGEPSSVGPMLPWLW